MSRRKSIANALAEALKDINGTDPYKTDLFNNVIPKLKFWDEVQDFPHVSVVAGQEQREYLPAQFKWGWLSVSLKVYVKGEEPQDILEQVLEDIERCIDANNNIPYGEGSADRAVEIHITSITTDEGLLAPYGVGEINLQVQYQVL